MAGWPAVRGAALVACVVLASACGKDDGGKDPGQQPQPTGCTPACGADQICVDGACVDVTPPGPDADGDGVTDEKDVCAATPAGSAVNAEGCAWDEEPVAWSEGPYGLGIRDTAGDFTLNTLAGPWSFRTGWTGNDSYVFLIHVAGQSYTEQLWASDPGALLAESLPNVHYFFLSSSGSDTDRTAAVEQLRGKFDTALSALEDQAAAQAWRSRLHFVTDALGDLDGAAGEFVREFGQVGFAIDRFQRWREVGMLVDMRRNEAQLRFLGREARGFEYERRLERKMGAIDATEVTIFDGGRHAGGWEAGYNTDVQITLPSAAEMKAFDSMAVYLYTACPDHLQGLQAGCNEWDYAHNLFLCDADDATKCDTELVRYVTPYGREGEWLTDVSELLPLFDAGGTRTLRYSGANGYDMHMRILLWNAGKSHRPVELRFLWGQSGAIKWDENYNALFAPVTFTVDDPNTTKVGIYNVVTGHGFGSTWENCAEFCNHQHEFTVNGSAYMEEHADAKDNEGCYKLVDEGVVPNQFGTWPFGRAGWCPGQDVKPWVQDVSDVLVSGENTIGYRALFRDEPYTPRPNNQGDYMPELRLQTWLVRYEAR